MAIGGSKNFRFVKLRPDLQPMKVVTVTLGHPVVQQSPDNHTMLNHTTLLFAPNLPGIKWNVNKFALIIAQESPDNCTILFQFSTLTASI